MKKYIILLLIISGCGYVPEDKKENHYDSMGFPTEEEMNRNERHDYTVLQATKDEFCLQERTLNELYVKRLKLLNEKLTDTEAQLTESNRDVYLYRKDLEKTIKKYVK